MEMFISIGEIILRAIISIFILFLLAKLMGEKQISQLNFFDYAVGISIGSIAAAMAIEDDRPFHFPLIAMIVYAVFAFLLSLVADKTLKLRRIINGIPILLMDNGKLVYENFKRARIDLNEFLCEARVGGYFNPSEIQYAILETNGKISFLPYSDKRPAQPADMGITPKNASLVATVVIDGKISYENLKNIGKDEQWLLKEFESKNIFSVNNIFLATCDDNGYLAVYLKDDAQPHKHNIFE